MDLSTADPYISSSLRPFAILHYQLCMSRGQTVETVCVRGRTLVHTWRSEDNLSVSTVSYYVSLRDHTQMVRLGCGVFTL